MWLSPFGEEVTSAADLPRMAEVSKAKHEERKEERAAQYAASNRRKRRKADPVPVEDTEHPEDGRSKRRSRLRPAQIDSVESVMHSTCTRLEDGTVILKRDRK